MSFGISLSQLIVDNPKPIRSGIRDLDDILQNGFQSRSIYEIYGPPGIGKTKLGLQIVHNVIEDDGKVLWVETHKGTSLQEFQDGAFDIVNITKFGEMVFFLQKMMEVNTSERSYDLVVVDGFSQIVSDHLNAIRRHYDDIKEQSFLSTANSPSSASSASSSSFSSYSKGALNLHDIKCRHLIMIFTLMTKYTHSSGSTIILLDDSMNTAYEIGGIASAEDGLEVIDDGSNFFLRASADSRRKNVQVLRSALVSNVGVGIRDSRWEVFLKNRIGIFWDWYNKEEVMAYVQGKKRPKLDACRIAMVFDLRQSNKKRNRELEAILDSRISRGGSNLSGTSSSAKDSNSIVQFYCNSDGKFVSYGDRDSITADENENELQVMSASDSVASSKRLKMSSPIPSSYDEYAPLALRWSESGSTVSIASSANNTVLSGTEDIVYDSEG